VPQYGSAEVNPPHNPIAGSWQSRLLLRALFFCRSRLFAGMIQLKLKDFEGIYAPAHQKYQHFLA